MALPRTPVSVPDEHAIQVAMEARLLKAKVEFWEMLSRTVCSLGRLLGHGG